MLSEDQRALFEGKNFGHIATVMPDGSPQVTPVWVELEGDSIVVNTAEGRVKTANVRRDPRVAISIIDQDNPYGMVAVRGVVEEITQEGGKDGIDRLAKKYLNEDEYPWLDERFPRVILRIRPEHVSQM